MQKPLSAAFVKYLNLIKQPEMYKKPSWLLWMDTKIKTKEDFQLFIVTLFVVFIICTKCYMVFASKISIHREANQNHTTLSDQTFTRGYSFTK